MSLLPVPQSIYERAVLFDTCALLAIFDPRDQYRGDALLLFRKLIKHSYPLYITSQTIAETQRRILYTSHLGYPKAINFLEFIYDESINIIRPSEQDELQAIEYIRRYNDQSLSLTDAINMAVMKRMGIMRVFTFDRHFTLLGFQAIPPL